MLKKFEKSEKHSKHLELNLTRFKLTSAIDVVVSTYCRHCGWEYTVGIEFTRNILLKQYYWMNFHFKLIIRKRRNGSSKKIKKEEMGTNNIYIVWSIRWTQFRLNEARIFLFLCINTLRTTTMPLWVRLKIYANIYILIDVLNPYAKIHHWIIYSFVRITEWSRNFSKIWTFYMTLGFKPNIVKKLDRIDNNFVTQSCSESFDLS